MTSHSQEVLFCLVRNSSRIVFLILVFSDIVLIPYAGIPEQKAKKYSKFALLCPSN